MTRPVAVHVSARVSLADLLDVFPQVFDFLFAQRAGRSKWVLFEPVLFGVKLVVERLCLLLGVLVSVDEVFSEAVLLHRLLTQGTPHLLVSDHFPPLMLGQNVFSHVPWNDLDATVGTGLLGCMHANNVGPQMLEPLAATLHWAVPGHSGLRNGNPVQFCNEIFLLLWCFFCAIPIPQVWSLTQFYSVDFSQSMIGVKKYV